MTRGLRSVRNEAGSTEDVYLYTPIGAEYQGGVSAKQFIDTLRAIDSGVSKIRLHILSLGGSAFDAKAMRNALLEERRRGRTVDVIVDGIAASAATILLVAGQRRQIVDDGLICIHNATTFAFGDATEMRQAATMLDEVMTSMVVAYRTVVQMSEAELLAAMQKETWYGADEAIANGFATEKVGVPANATARVDNASMQAFAAKLHVPDRCRARFDRLTGGSRSAARPNPGGGHGWDRAFKAVNTPPGGERTDNAPKAGTYGAFQRARRQPAAAGPALISTSAIGTDPGGF